MNDDIARARLARVPASLRAAMMAQRAELPPEQSPQSRGFMTF